MQLVGIILMFVLAGLIYLPIARLARRDLQERRARGESDGAIFWVMMIPLIGPLIYLLVRKKS